MSEIGPRSLTLVVLFFFFFFFFVASGSWSALNLYIYCTFFELLFKFFSIFFWIYFCFLILFLIILSIFIHIKFLNHHNVFLISRSLSLKAKSLNVFYLPNEFIFFKLYRWMLNMLHKSHRLFGPLIIMDFQLFLYSPLFKLLDARLLQQVLRILPNFLIDPSRQIILKVFLSRAQFIQLYRLAL